MHQNLLSHGYIPNLDRFRHQLHPYRRCATALRRRPHSTSGSPPRARSGRSSTVQSCHFLSRRPHYFRLRYAQLPRRTGAYSFSTEPETRQQQPAAHQSVFSLRGIGVTCFWSNNQHRSPAVRFHSGSSSASASQQPTIPKRRRLVIDSDDEEGDIIPEDYEDDTTLTKEKGKGKAEEEEAAAPLTKTARRRFAQGQIKNSTDE
ncbi:hypothetical protein CF319_g9081 [Tilletia indica]|nr:hypothetical protein CF319_g9081 [Tilletia indica]